MFQTCLQIKTTFVSYSVVFVVSKTPKYPTGHKQINPDNKTVCIYSIYFLMEMLQHGIPLDGAMNCLTVTMVAYSFTHVAE